MNNEQAAKVLSVFTAAHPKIQLMPQTISVWFEAALRETDYDLGMKLAMDLVSRPASRAEFPTPAMFNEARRMALHQQRMKTNPLEALADGDGVATRLPTEQARKLFDAMRAQLRNPTPQPETQEQDA